MTPLTPRDIRYLLRLVQWDAEVCKNYRHSLCVEGKLATMLGVELQGEKSDRPTSTVADRRAQMGPMTITVFPHRKEEKMAAKKKSASKPSKPSKSTSKVTKKK